MTMKNKITMLTMAVFAMIMTACSSNEASPEVAPPSWKGFNYIVKKAVGDEYEQTERGPISPGDELKVYAVRKSHGKLVGQINGTIYIRYTAYMKTGAPQTEILDKSVISTPNANLDGWEDPYATFTLPELDGEYEYYKVEAACQLYFRAFGNQNSVVNFSDSESHMDPYLGNIYTEMAEFHPMNGGSANSGRVTGGLQYHTIYTTNK